jgi:hypothetical protein
MRTNSGLYSILILISSIGAGQVMADCYQFRSVQGCGGGSGTHVEVERSISITGPTDTWCDYTDSVGYVGGCLGGFSDGYSACDSPTPVTCMYTRTYSNCQDGGAGFSTQNTVDMQNTYPVSDICTPNG